MGSLQKFEGEAGIFKIAQLYFQTLPKGAVYIRKLHAGEFKYLQTLTLCHSCVMYIIWCNSSSVAAVIYLDVDTFTVLFGILIDLHKTGKLKTGKTYVLFWEILETETPENEKLGKIVTRKN